MDAFCDELLQAALARGTVRKVAEALEVHPEQLYRWIGGLEPCDRRRPQVVARLRQLRLFEAYFERRGRRQGAAWQQ